MQAIRLSDPLNRGTTTDIGVDTFISTIGSEGKREYTYKLRSGIFNGNVTEKKMWWCIPFENKAKFSPTSFTSYWGFYQIPRETKLFVEVGG